MMQKSLLSRRFSFPLKGISLRFLLTGGALLLGGLLLGWGSSVILGNALEKRAARLWDPFSQKGGALPDPRSSVELPRGMRFFLDRSPFEVLPRKEIPPEEIQKKGSPLAHELEDLQITGTVAGVFALGNSSQGKVLLEQGEIFRGFLVAIITGDGVYFDPQDGGEPVIKSLFFGAQGARVSSSAPKNPAPAPQAISSPRQDIKPAAPGSTGQVSRNLVNSLLMNPFDELKKVRLQPKHVEGKPQGLEVAHIEQDSILATLGVRQGDVVQGLNGIRINHMGDVANAINSLMGGKRFDVTVIRGGKQELLSYQVQ